MSANEVTPSLNCRGVFDAFSDSFLVLPIVLFAAISLSSAISLHCWYTCNVTSVRLIPAIMSDTWFSGCENGVCAASSG